MKVDKETLIKQRFWIALGAFGLLWLIAFLVVLFGAGSTVEASRKKVDDVKKEVNNLKDPKNEYFTVPLTGKTKVLTKQKDKVWKKAWDPQSDMMTWPDIPSGPALAREGYFAQDIGLADRQRYLDVYRDQLKPEEEKKKLQPIDADWEGGLIRIPKFSTKDPSTEELWLTQEDIWVQRELLNVVKAALDSVAKFQDLAVFQPVEIAEEDKVKDDKAKEEQAKEPAAAAPAPPAPAATPGAAEEKPAEPKVTVQRLRYRNPLWQLDLVLEEKDKKEMTLSGKSTITNINPDKQPLPGLTFRLAQTGPDGQDAVTAPPVVFAAGDQPVAPGKSVELKNPVPLARFVAAAPITVTLVEDKSDPLPQGVVARHRLRSPNWELELLVVQDPKDGRAVLSEKSKVKNVNRTRRPLPLATAAFRLSQGNRSGPKEPLIIPSDPLGWGESTDIRKPYPVPTFDVSLPIDVEQVFYWSTSPIKRLEKIALFKDAQSHKTSYIPLRQAEQFAKVAAAEAAAKEAAGGAGAAGGGPAGGMGGAGMMGPGMQMQGGMAGMMGGGAGGPGAGGKFGAGGSGDTTPNGLVKDRYIYVSDQVRRMPVALQLIVDQANVEDVLTAVANSRLRIQVTQVQWQQAHDIKPPAGESAAPAKGQPAGGGGKGPLSMGSPAPTSGGPLLTPPGGTPSSGANADESDPNLLDLAVYGIASLYERYPPKPAAPAGAGATPAPQAAK
jgi:hypothetical protein